VSDATRARRTAHGARNKAHLFLELGELLAGGLGGLGIDLLELLNLRLVAAHLREALGEIVRERSRAGEHEQVRRQGVRDELDPVLQHLQLLLAAQPDCLHAPRRVRRLQLCVRHRAQSLLQPPASAHAHAHAHTR
jgi:hypothetical protein